MRALLLVVVLAMLALPTAKATTSFGYSDHNLSIQFVGRDFSPEFRGMIELSGKTGPHALRPETYQLSNYVYRKSLRLEFVNPGDDSLPPSFTLTVSGEQGAVETEGKIFVGHFSWES